jgi:hypothetical protein
MTMRYLVAGKGFVTLLLLLLPAEPRYSGLEELRSGEKKHEHKHIAHPSALGICLEKDITAREKVMARVCFGGGGGGGKRG